MSAPSASSVKMSMERISPPPEPGAEAFGLRISAKEVCPVVEPVQHVESPGYVSMVIGYVPAPSEPELRQAMERDQIRHAQKDDSEQDERWTATHRVRHREFELPQLHIRNKWDKNGIRPGKSNESLAKSSADRGKEASTARDASPSHLCKTATGRQGQGSALLFVLNLHRS